MKFYLRILDWLTAHKIWCWSIFGIMVVLLSVSAFRLRFKEDISDFLPMDEKQQKEMQIYRELSNSDQIVVLFSLKDTSTNNPDRLCDAIDDYAATIHQEIQTQIDIESHYHTITDIFEHIPYYLTEADYAKMDSTLSRQSIDSLVAQCKNKLLMPMSSLLTRTMVYDPLELFPIQELTSQINTSAFTSYDGYMMSAEMDMAFAFMQSPYGDSETKRNALLVDSLQIGIDAISANYEDVNIRLIGGPPVAVSNSRQIKKDSFIAISIALVLIVLLLAFSIHDIRSIGLILAATGFGLLFAMGIMGIVHPEMSLIVMGIASVIIGIAVNYPLHILVHRQYTTTIRETLQEEVTPLVIGNVTTIGAFLTLVPLNSVALRDLGIFCAAMLIGTIVFTIFFLPQCKFSTPRFDSFSIISKSVDKISIWRPEKSKILIVLLVVLTIVFGWFSRKPSFDSNLSHINFLTKQQKADFATLSAIMGQESDEVEVFLPCVEKLDIRAQRWNNFWETRKDETIKNLREAAIANGFREDAFCQFERLIQQAANSEIPSEAQLTKRVFVPKSELKTYLAEHPEAFAVSEIQKDITNSLSSNFNYIGIACSLIVFIFLWISFKKFWIALVAFMPMVVSWLWILGIMNICAIQFNIVNIILATFIFGQGDDYTIFITEGLLYEQRTGKTMLPQYKNEITLSALVMFIGIGVLVIAKHPAMFSLGAVVLIGMTSVVIMANLVPPILFQLKKQNIKAKKS